MSLKEDAQPPQRRRGAALENALLDAAWQELSEKGYDAFTIESVAERAQTSRAVIYRRWATKPDLVTASIAHQLLGERNQTVIPDTGSLREDLVTLLKRANATRAPLGLLVTARLGGYYDDTGRSIADLRELFLEGRTSSLDVVLERAVARGEADPTKLTPRVRGVAYDLFRQELFMTQSAVPDEVIESIVDEVVLPLVRPTS